MAKKGTRSPLAPPNTPASRYATEFLAAWHTTERLGLEASPLQLVTEKDCLDMPRAMPILQD